MNRWRLQSLAPPTTRIGPHFFRRACSCVSYLKFDPLPLQQSLQHEVLPFELLDD